MITDDDMINLQIWEKNHIKDCDTRQMFRNKKVLEVGGMTPPDVARKLGVRSWSCVDPCKTSAEANTNFYKTYKECISDFTKDEGFDLIFSTNCFEHIVNLEESLNHMYDLLASGGSLSALMGPIYSCHKGHHTSISSPKYGWIDFNNLKLDKWGYLIYSEEELYDKLSQYYDEETCIRIVNQIVCGKTTNRLFFDDYLDIINHSKFKIREFRDWHESQYPDEATFKKLQKYHKKNFSTVSIKIILEA